jgi:hypothetical protein
VLGIPQQIVRIEFYVVARMAQRLISQKCGYQHRME